MYMYKIQPSSFTVTAALINYYMYLKACLYTVDYPQWMDRKATDKIKFYTGCHQPMLFNDVCMSLPLLLFTRNIMHLRHFLLYVKD